jgi:uncharacterized protein (DUF1778 family)
MDMETSIVRRFAAQRVDLCGKLPYTKLRVVRTMPTETAVSKRTERLDARVTKEEKRVVETAANLRGISVTDLMRTAITDAANKIIRENEILTLSERERQAFVQALVNPAPPNDAAIAAVRRYRREVR